MRFYLFFILLSNIALANEQIFSDYKNLISSEFKISKYYHSSVEFWFNIYTKYNSLEVIIHDKDNLKIIYKVLDFKDLKKENISDSAMETIKNKYSREYLKNLKQVLINLGDNKKKLSPEENSILMTLKKASLKIPKDLRKRKDFFNQLSKNLREQSGQKNMIEKGLKRFLPYENLLNSYFSSSKLPKELIAITFLESSFNSRATSKAKAVGAWQFMPLIASYFLPKREKYLDYRYNPILSTLAATHLLKENFQILKSWDLAITAYNTGTKYLLKAKNKITKGNNTFNLEMLLENYSHAHLGFASTNFYTEFLALAYALAYRDQFYSLSENKDAQTYELQLNFYLTKCSLVPHDLYKNLQTIEPFIRDFNSHFLNEKFTYESNKLILSYQKLDEKKFELVPLSEISKTRPKFWTQNLKDLKKCKY